MNQTLIRFVASHAKNYPRGIPARPVGREPDSAPKIAFYSESPLDDAERELLRGAAEKGLKLQPNQYLIAVSPEKPRAEVLIILGPGARPELEYSRVIRTLAASEVLASPDKKRAFWEDIKRI